MIKFLALVLLICLAVHAGPVKRSEKEIRKFLKSISEEYNQDEYMDYQENEYEDEDEDENWDEKEAENKFDDEDDGDKTQVPFYRYWNAGITDHFYTTNFNELGTGRNGWKYEGVQCKIYKCKRSGSVPLYRYWNGNDHFYTTYIAEIGTSVPGATGRHGYKSEGVAGYCFRRRRRGTIPLYRYYKNNGNDHFYTTNKVEIGTSVPGQIGKYGYRNEGVACYVFPK